MKIFRRVVISLPVFGMYIREQKSREEEKGLRRKKALPKWCSAGLLLSSSFLKRYIK